MADENDPKKTPEAQEPAEVTPVTPEAPRVLESSEEIRTYLDEQGIDLSNPEVQAELMKPDFETEQLIEKFGKKQDAGNKGAPDNVRPADPISGQEKPEDADEPKTEEEEEEDARKKDSKKIRFTPKTEEDRVIMDIARNKGISILEASRIYNGGDSGDKGSEPAEPKADPQLEEFDTRITEADTQIKDLQAKIKTARDDADFDEAFELQEQLFDLKSEYRDLTREKKAYEQNTQAQTEAEYNRGVAVSSQRAMEQYPPLAKAGSLARRAFDAYVAEHDGNDPIFKTTDWPEVLAERFAEETPELSQSPADKRTDGQDGKPPKQAQPTQQPARPAQSRAAMLDGGQGGPESPAPTDESTKPPSIDEAMGMYADLTSEMSIAEKEAFDRDIYKSLQAPAAKP